MSRTLGRPYPIVVEVGYTVTLDGRRVDTGYGWTLRMSSTLIQFAPSRPLVPGNGIELAIAWPALLHESVGLQLSIRGSVVESKTNCVAVQILRYEFRTRSLKAVGIQDVLAPMATIRVRCLSPAPPARRRVDATQIQRKAHSAGSTSRRYKGRVQEGQTHRESRCEKP